MSRAATGRPGQPGRPYGGGGDPAELIFAAIARKRGWEVLFPFGSYQYDVVVRSTNGFNRVQVKQMRPAANGRQLRADVTMGDGRRYERDAFDYLAAVYENRVWLVPAWRLGEIKAFTVPANKPSQIWDQYLL